MAARARRKRHVQQELFRRGGRRRGAGRKPKGKRSGERHEARPEFKAHQPLHVVMRVAPAVGSLRRRTMYKALREATITAAMRERFRIVHVSLQRSHVHMLVEAEHKMALGRGMQGFTISAAKNINLAFGDGEKRRRGKVFSDRYHVEVIRSAMCSGTGATTRKISAGYRARGLWTLSRRESCSRTGPSCRTSRGCGRSARRMTRWSCSDRERGCSARDGGAEAVRSVRAMCRGAAVKRDVAMQGDLRGGGGPAARAALGGDGGTAGRGDVRWTGSG